MCSSCITIWQYQTSLILWILNNQCFLSHNTLFNLDILYQSLAIKSNINYSIDWKIMICCHINHMMTCRAIDFWKLNFLIQSNRKITSTPSTWSEQLSWIIDKVANIVSQYWLIPLINYWRIWNTNYGKRLPRIFIITINLKDYIPAKWPCFPKCCSSLFHTNPRAWMLVKIWIFPNNPSTFR